MSWTIIYHYHDQPIHLDHLYKSNPNAQIIPIHTPNNRTVDISSKHSDRYLRPYLKNIFDIIYYDDILLIEWDVYINQEIPRFDFSSMFGKYVLTNISSGWCWWTDIKNLPEEYKEYATGLPLWGFTGIKKICLQEILKDKYDTFYDLDVHTEIKSPTLLKSLGYDLSSYPTNWGKYLLNAAPEDIEFMNNVLFENPEATGFFHPVKKPINVTHES